MDPSILAAVVTGLAAIVAAVIQAVSAVRVARIKEGDAQAEPAAVRPRLQTTAAAHSHAWWWIGGILVVTNFLWIIILGKNAPFVIHLGAIPWCTCLLAYFRPLRWGYVASIVTLVSAIAVLSYFLLGESYEESDVAILALLFIANSILAAGISFFAQRTIS